jgi:hypothetical protein
MKLGFRPFGIIRKSGESMTKQSYWVVQSCCYCKSLIPLAIYNQDNHYKLAESFWIRHDEQVPTATAMLWADTHTTICKNTTSSLSPISDRISPLPRRLSVATFLCQRMSTGSPVINKLPYFLTFFVCVGVENAVMIYVVLAPVNVLLAPRWPRFEIP